MHYRFFFFFNDTATTEIYTLSLHDAFRSKKRFERRATADNACSTAPPLSQVRYRQKYRKRDAQGTLLGRQQLRARVRAQAPRSAGGRTSARRARLPISPLRRLFAGRPRVGG